MNAAPARWPLAVAAGAASVLLLAGPAAAAASLSVSRSSDGSAVTVDQPLNSNDVLDISGQTDPGTSTTQLVVTPPAGGAQVVASARATYTQGATMSFALDTGCLSYQPKQSPCTGSNPAPNGTWTVQLQGGESASTQFVLRIPPAPPQGVTASGSGSTVTVAWRPNTEPDLVSYAILDGSGSTLAAGLNPSTVCSNGSCTAQVSAPRSASVAVAAQRATCPGCAQTLSSTSAPAQVSWPASAPSGGGSATGSSSSSASGSSSSSASGGPATSSSPAPGGSTRSAATPAPTGGGSRRSASGGAVASGTWSVSAPGGGDASALLQQLLPGPSAVSAPAVQQATGALPGQQEPSTWGTYSSTLGYGPLTVGQLVTVPGAPQPRLAAEPGPVVGWAGASLWRSLAEALLLLLAAGHVAAWLRRTPAGD